MKFTILIADIKFIPTIYLYNCPGILIDLIRTYIFTICHINAIKWLHPNNNSQPNFDRIFTDHFYYMPSKNRGEHVYDHDIVQEDDK